MRYLTTERNGLCSPILEIPDSCKIQLGGHAILRNSRDALIAEVVSRGLVFRDDQDGIAGRMAEIFDALPPGIKTAFEPARAIISAFVRAGRKAEAAQALQALTLPPELDAVRVELLSKLQ